MGLAASQGRYLALTARHNDLTYEAQQIARQRLTLATQNQQVADEYNEAMSNTVLLVNVPDGSQRLTYDVITSQDPFSGLNMRIVDSNGNVVVPPNPSSINVTYKDENGEDVTETITDPREFANKYMGDDIQINNMANWSLEDLAEYYNENYATTDTIVQYDAGIADYLKSGNERYLFDPNCKDPDYLQKMIASGEWSLQQPDASGSSDWVDIDWRGTTSITEEYDTSDDAAAEAKYQTDMVELQRIDKMLEIRLEQVQTEQSAIEKEMESVKKIISKNIESTFKTFT
ncbi:hypothetical protein IJD44_01605 [bacterium]|nr:hypothetical protein [bacterium]